MCIRDRGVTVDEAVKLRTDAILQEATVPIEVAVRPIEPQGKLIGFASVNYGGVVIDDFKVVDGKNGIFLGAPSKPDPTSRTGYRSTVRINDRATQERLKMCIRDRDTVDWNDRKYGEIWRHEWEVIQNRYLEANNRPERVDLRSYERQGLDIIPTVHEGAAVRQMEKRGIQTNIGNLNREIKAANSLMKSIRQLIQNLKEMCIRDRCMGCYQPSRRLRK